MNTFQDRVKSFHDKNKFPYAGQPVPANTDALMDVAAQLTALAKQIQPQAVAAQGAGDERLYRAHLNIEELGEFLQALAEGNRHEMADAIADRLYVTLGDAVTYDLPAEALLTEVCNSNDSKKARCPETNPRMRDKGPNYRPPNIEGVLLIHASKQKA